MQGFVGGPAARTSTENFRIQGRASLRNLGLLVAGEDSRRAV